MSSPPTGHTQVYTPGVTISPPIDPAAWPGPVAAFYAWLQTVEVDGLGATGMVEAMTGLERVSRSATAVQSRVAHRLGQARLVEREELVEQAKVDGSSLPPSHKQVDRGSGGEIGLSRRTSARQGLTFLHRARDLADLPVTSAAWLRGSITEQTAAMIATETGVLDTTAERQWVDQHLARVLESAISHKQLTKLVKALVAKVNLTAALRRGEIARRERRVTTRPAAVGMAWLTGTLPTEDAVAIMAVLDRRVQKAKADPHDHRSRGQVMADTLTELVTGHLAAEHHPEPPPDNSNNETSAHDDDSSSSDISHGDSAGSDAGTGDTNDASEDGGSENGPGEQDDDEHHDSASTAAPESDHGDSRQPGSDAQPDEGPGQAGQTSTARENDPPSTSSTATNSGRADADHHASPPTTSEPDPDSGPVAAQPRGRPGIELRLVMSMDTFFNNDAGQGTALLNGEPIPGYAARAMLTADADTQIMLRRLFTHPTTGQLVGLESTARAFTGGLRDLVATRDHHCRNPYCGAPIRHIDHVRADHLGGPTSAINGQGLCEACNYLKESPGWRSETIDSPYPGAPPDVLLITPTGHTYTSSPPPVLPACHCPAA